MLRLACRLSRVGANVFLWSIDWIDWIGTIKKSRERLNKMATMGGGMDTVFMSGFLTGMLFSVSGLYGFSAGFFCAILVLKKLKLTDLSQILAQKVLQWGVSGTVIPGAPQHS